MSNSHWVKGRDFVLHDLDAFLVAALVAVARARYGGYQAFASHRSRARCHRWSFRVARRRRSSLRSWLVEMGQVLDLEMMPVSLQSLGHQARLR